MIPTMFSDISAMYCKAFALFILHKLFASDIAQSE